jgi:hypothetical protein
MPGATHSVIDKQPFGERPTVVGARGTDGEDVRATPGKEYWDAMRVPGKQGAVSHIARIDARREIGARELRFVGAHA